MQLFLVIVRSAMLDSCSTTLFQTKIFVLILDGLDGYKQEPQTSYPQTPHPHRSESYSNNHDSPVRSSISLSGFEPLLLL